LRAILLATVLLDTGGIPSIRPALLVQRTTTAETLPRSAQSVLVTRYLNLGPMSVTHVKSGSIGTITLAKSVTNQTKLAMECSVCSSTP